MDIRPLCGLRFYRFYDYDLLYGSGGTLCYRVELCVAVLAIQNPEGAQRACEAGEVSDATFEAVYDRASPRHEIVEISAGEWRIAHGPETANAHNYDSDVGPGPWIVAVLDRISYDEVAHEYVNYGVGERDVYPCPLKPDRRDLARPLAAAGGWSSSYTCDPGTCSSAPLYPGKSYGCYKCDTHSRVAYVFARTTLNPALDRQAEVYDTKQRWETTSYAACFYLANAYLYNGSPPPPT